MLEPGEGALPTWALDSRKREKVNHGEKPRIIKQQFEV